MLKLKALIKNRESQSFTARTSSSFSHNKRKLLTDRPVQKIKTQHSLTKLPTNYVDWKKLNSQVENFVNGKVYLSARKETGQNPEKIDLHYLDKLRKLCDSKPLRSKVGRSQRFLRENVKPHVRNPELDIIQPQIKEFCEDELNKLKELQVQKHYFFEIYKKTQWDINNVNKYKSFYYKQSEKAINKYYNQYQKDKAERQKQRKKSFLGNYQNNRNEIESKFQRQLRAQSLESYRLVETKVPKEQPIETMNFKDFLRNKQKTDHIAIQALVPNIMRLMQSVKREVKEMQRAKQMFQMCVRNVIHIKNKLAQLKLTFEEALNREVFVKRSFKEQDSQKFFGIVKQDDAMEVKKMLKENKFYVYDLNEILEKRFESPLHIAVKKGYFELCQMLIIWGSNVDAEDISGIRPLYQAFRYGFSEIIQLLLLKGANPWGNQRNCYKKYMTNLNKMDYLYLKQSRRLWLIAALKHQKNIGEYIEQNQQLFTEQ